jgi:hypothetical protein
MKIIRGLPISGLLSLLLALPGYGGSIEDDINQYYTIIVSAKTHYKEGKAAFDMQRPIDAALAIGGGEEAVQIAKKQEQILRNYLDAHHDETGYTERTKDLTDYAGSLTKIAESLEALKKSLPSFSTASYSDFPNWGGSGSWTWGGSGGPGSWTNSETQTWSEMKKQLFDKTLQGGSSQ